MKTEFLLGYLAFRVKGIKQNITFFQNMYSEGILWKQYFWKKFHKYLKVNFSCVLGNMYSTDTIRYSPIDFYKTFLPVLPVRTDYIVRT